MNFHQHQNSSQKRHFNPQRSDGVQKQRNSLDEDKNFQRRLNEVPFTKKLQSHDENKYFLNMKASPHVAFKNYDKLGMEMVDQVERYFADNILR